MTDSSVVSAAHSRSTVRVIELIPRKNALVLFRSPGDPEPDADVVDELRMHAYERAGAADLGAADLAADAMNLVRVMADGVLGAAAWEGLRATKRFVDLWRARPVPPVTSPQEAGAQAVRAAAAIAPAASAGLSVHATEREESGWTVGIALPDGRRMTVSLDPACTLADVQVASVAQCAEHAENTEMSENSERTER